MHMPDASLATTPHPFLDVTRKKKREEKKQASWSVVSHSELEGIGGGGADAAGAGELWLAVEAPLPAAAVHRRRAWIPHLKKKKKRRNHHHHETPWELAVASKITTDSIGSWWPAAYIRGGRHREGDEQDQSECGRRCKGAPHLLASANLPTYYYLCRDIEI